MVKMGSKWMLPSQDLLVMFNYSVIMAKSLIFIDWLIKPAALVVMNKEHPINAHT